MSTTLEVRPARREDLAAMDAAVPAPDNVGAQRLYRRLGFTGSTSYVDRYTVIDDAGSRHDSADTCVFLTAPSAVVAET